MNSTFIFTNRNFSSWNNFFGNWNRREKQAATKILALVVLAVGFALFPVRALEGYFKPSAPVIAPSNALDPAKIDALMKSLVTAKAPACVNPVPLRCESPVRWMENGG